MTTQELLNLVNFDIALDNCCRCCQALHTRQGGEPKNKERVNLTKCVAYCSSHFPAEPVLSLVKKLWMGSMQNWLVSPYILCCSSWVLWKSFVLMLAVSVNVQWSATRVCSGPVVSHSNNWSWMFECCCSEILVWVSARENFMFYLQEALLESSEQSHLLQYCSLAARALNCWVDLCSSVGLKTSSLIPWWSPHSLFQKTILFADLWAVYFFLIYICSSIFRCKYDKTHVVSSFPLYSSARCYSF